MKRLGLLLGYACWKTTSAWTPSVHRCRRTTFLYVEKAEWSAADDWEALSSSMNLRPKAFDRNEDETSPTEDMDSFLHSLSWEAELQHFKEDLELPSETTEEKHVDTVADTDGTSKPGTDDPWLENILDEYLLDPEHDPGYGATNPSEEDDDGGEIARMVRCNESPTHLLYETGRAIEPLSVAARDDVNQLLEENEPTEFFQKATTTMFDRFSNEDALMDATNVAAWMKICLGDVVTAFDPRVRSVLKNGVVTLEAFQELYLTAAQLRPEAVWRDLRAHGIVSPNESKHRLAVDAVRNYSEGNLNDDFIDECSLILGDEDDQSGTGDRFGNASYNTVELVPGTEHPLTHLMTKPTMRPTTIGMHT